jgi:hypothetical protein
VRSRNLGETSKAVEPSGRKGLDRGWSHARRCPNLDDAIPAERRDHHGVAVHDQPVRAVEPQPTRCEMYVATGCDVPSGIEVVSRVDANAVARWSTATRGGATTAAYGEHVWGITSSDGSGPARGHQKGLRRRFYDYIARGVRESAEYIAVWFKRAGHEATFFWYVALVCGIVPCGAADA